MLHDRVGNRREFLGAAAVAGGLPLAMVPCAVGGAGVPPEPGKTASTGEALPPMGISLVETLMHGHGVLQRLLLIFEHAASRLEQGQEFATVALAFAASMAREFVEDCHERLEEDLVFPRLEKAGKHTELIRTLRRQHDVGRIMSNNVVLMAGPDLPSRKDLHRVLATVLRRYVRMFRPHAAREDTVLIPSLRSIVPEKELRAMGEEFRAREGKTLDGKGFEEPVRRVEKLEKLLGLDDLAQYTPNGEGKSAASQPE